MQAAAICCLSLLWSVEGISCERLVGRMRTFLSNAGCSNCLLRGIRYLGRCSVRVGYCVLQVFDVMVCNIETMRVCGEVYDVAAIEQGS